MHILLVNPPWAPADLPSLAIGVLHSAISREFPEARIEEVHASLEWLDWAAARCEFTSHDYEYYSIQRYFRGLGDWVFSSALLGRLSPTPAGDEEREAMTSRLHALAPDFITELADRIVADAPDVVGFAVTFQTNVAALALANRIKQRRPGTVTVFGGANCDGPQGAALHRNFPAVDFVVRGEGDTALPRLLRLLTGGTPEEYAGIAGLCWRATDGRSMANPLATRPLPIEAIAPPDYAGYFQRWERCSARHTAEPQLVLESARGCWWGDKHACTFCGLNGSLTTFRSKPPDQFLNEIIDQVRRHQTLDVVAADNIIDNAYYQSLLPALARCEYDLRVQYEIRSNLRMQQLEALVNAGAAVVQPGIESLSTRVLDLMGKGVSGTQNVRMLRDAETVGLTVMWNYLCGFPGETERDYQEVIEQIPALHHLFPPQGCSRIALQRFSPYVENPELGFPEVVPHPQYTLSYDLPESELSELASLFDAPPQGISEEFNTELGEVLGDWRHNYPESQLSFLDVGHEIILTSRRPAFRWDRTLSTALEIETFRALDQPRTVASLTRALTGRLAAAPAADDLGNLLAQWRALGLVFEESGHLVQLAVPDRNQQLLRLGNTTACRPQAGTVHGRYPQATLTYQDFASDDVAKVTQRLVGNGVLRVTLPETVDLTDPGAEAARRAVRTLSLIQELTAQAIHVTWQATIPTDVPVASLHHLYPPTDLTGDDDGVECERWRDRFYVGMFTYRRGPGFIEVRDRRWDKLQRFTIDEREYLAAIEALTGLQRASDIPTDIIDVLVGERLAMRLGTEVWWAASPLRRWPLPAPL